MGEAYPLFRPGFNRSIQIEARDERLTSDAGLILLQKVRENLQIFEWLADHLKNRRDASRIDHSLAELLRTRSLALASGYED